MVFNRNLTGADGSKWWNLVGVYLNITTAANLSFMHFEEDLGLNYRIFRDIYTAPDNMSFACAEASDLTDLGYEEKNKTVNLVFYRFQVNL